jgi:hypothetical protein
VTPEVMLLLAVVVWVALVWDNRHHDIEDEA